MADDNNKISGLDRISGQILEKMEKMSPIIRFLYIKAGGLEDEMIQMKTGEKMGELISKFYDDPSVSDADKLFFLAQFKKIKKEIANKMAVVDFAKDYISKDADPKKVDEDWYTFFFDKAKKTTDVQTRIILANILKSEINAPGTISRSLIQTISIITKPQLEFFCNIARFCWDEWVDGRTKTTHPFIFVSTAPFANEDSNITWKNLKELELLRLVICDPTIGFALGGDRQFRKGSHLITVRAHMETKRIPTGNVILSDDGQALYNLLGSIEEGSEFQRFRDDIYRFTAEILQEKGCSVSQQIR